MTRSLVRTFVTVFLVILLGGFGVTGATALWSIKTNVTTQVATDTWIDYTRPGFSIPLTLSVQEKWVPQPFQRGVQISWRPVTAQDPSQQISYQVTYDDSVQKLRHRNGLPYTGLDTSVLIRTTTPLALFPPEYLRITITPRVKNANGEWISGQPTVKNLWVNNDGGMWLDDVS